MAVNGCSRVMVPLGREGADEYRLRFGQVDLASQSIGKRKYPLSMINARRNLSPASLSITPAL